ncbi:YopX protein [Helicobacter fennelliae]|uniref:YopX protein n=1 Tax=Helicobacter fennelliae TaxID=215 RepID=A0A2X3GMF4_9HELI|nr:YopX family protein [Helicobacter fennelliae]SQC36300.1 YopX protein [Helicobacter fennelliae]
MTIENFDFRIWDNKEQRFLTHKEKIKLLDKSLSQKLTNESHKRYIVEQYLEINDKTGKKIFIGDVVTIGYDKYLKDKKFEVMTLFGNIENITSKDRIWDTYSLSWDEKEFKKYKVIGNIHENAKFAKMKEEVLKYYLEKLNSKENE